MLPLAAVVIAIGFGGPVELRAGDAPVIAGVKFESYADGADGSHDGIDSLKRSLPLGLFPRVVESLQAGGAARPFGIAASAHSG